MVHGTNELKFILGTVSKKMIEREMNRAYFIKNL